MAEQIVQYEVKDQIAFVRMNRPDKLNALSLELSDALNETWTRFEADNPDTFIGMYQFWIQRPIDH